MVLESTGSTNDFLLFNHYFCSCCFSLASAADESSDFSHPGRRGKFWAPGKKKCVGLIAVKNS